MSVLAKPVLVLGAGLLAVVGTVGAMAGSGVMFAGASDGPSAAQSAPTADDSVDKGPVSDVIDDMPGPNDDMGTPVAADDGIDDQDRDRDRDRDQDQDQDQSRDRDRDQDHCCDEDGAEHMAPTDDPVSAQHQVGMQEEHHGDDGPHNGPHGDDEGDDGYGHDDWECCDSGGGQSGHEGPGRHGMD